MSPKANFVFMQENLAKESSIATKLDIKETADAVSTENEWGSYEWNT